MPWEVPSDYARGVQSAGWLTGAAKDIQDAINQQKMNKVANQLMNSGDYAPRAGLVSAGVDPATGKPNTIGADVSKVGTMPRTGGLTEYTLREKANEQNIINQLRQAQTVEALQRFSNRGTTPALTPYQQLQEQHYQTEQQRLAQERDQKNQDALTKSVRAWQEKNAQTLETLAKEVDTKYGKGASEDLFNSWSNGTMGRGDPDPNNPGSYIYNPNGQFYYTNPEYDQNGKVTKPARALKTYEFEDLLRRKKDIEDAGGRLLPAPRADLVNPNPSKVVPIPPANSGDVNKPLTQIPNATLPKPTTKEEYDAIPPGAQFVDTDGQTKTKTQ